MESMERFLSYILDLKKEILIVVKQQWQWQCRSKMRQEFHAGNISGKSPPSVKSMDKTDWRMIALNLREERERNG